MKYTNLAILPFVFISLPLTGSRSRLVAPDTIAQEFNRIQEDLRNFTAKDGYSRSIARYRKAAQDAERLGYLKYSTIFLNDLGACQLATFHFRDALSSLTEARRLAEQAKDHRSLLSLGTNISSVYMQMGNLQESADAAERGLIYRDDVAADLRARSLTQLGRLRAELGQFDRAEALFSEAIDDALKSDILGGQHLTDTEAAAWAWDALAYARQKAGKPAASEYAATQGLRYREMSPVSARESSYMLLGAARAAQGDYASGIALLTRAEAALEKPGSRTAPWRIYEARGKIELQAGQLEPALKDLRTAVSLARTWRGFVIANDVNRIGTEETLAELYGLVVDAGNRLYQRNHDEALIRETFEAAEENRVASLRAMRFQHDDWRGRLPPGYMGALGQLQISESEWLRSGQSVPPPELRQLRFKIAQMEAEAGAPAPEENAQALIRARRNLGEDAALFSFQLGDNVSWLWAVTGHKITLHELAGRAELTRAIQGYNLATQTASPTLAAEGKALYRKLFGSIEPEALHHERWLLALDGILFDLPFSALDCGSGEPLIVHHSLQIATGALMLQPAGTRDEFRRSFLGVGDPIYNAADPRWRAANRTGWRIPLSFTLEPASRDNSPVFARLWGTGREVQASAAALQANQSTILTGADASGPRFWEAVKRKPSVIHLATHILESENRLGTGWIALSKNGSGELDYVTPEQIAARTVTARLVVLSGCSSGRAQVRTASGLMGLTRAWVAAGVGGVLATRWPTVDDDGAFFEAFYRNLRTNEGSDPAQALRAASLEMLKSGTWRANESFWSGYFLVGNN